MKRISVFLATVFLATVCLAQKNVLVIPFDAKMFNNQEAQKICEYSGVSYSKSVDKIRNDLDMHIYMALKDSLKVSSLLRSYTTDASTDLEIVHGNAAYFISENDSEENITKPSKKKAVQNPNITAGEITSVKTDVSGRTVNVKLHDPQLFSDLIQNYQAQYVVFLTQFELLGDFSNPYAVGDNSYQRTIRVHYVIYNSLGKFVNGGIATTEFSAKVNDLDQICDQYLPRIAKAIAKKIH